MSEEKRKEIEKLGYYKLINLIEEKSKDLVVNANKDNKSRRRKARKISLELEFLLKRYRKISIERDSVTLIKHNDTTIKHFGVKSWTLLPKKEDK